MKRLLAKTLTSAALVLVTVTAAQADNRGDQPPHLFSPEQLQTWEKRDALITKEMQEEAKRRTRPQLRPPYLPWTPPVFTPEQLQYWYGREDALAKELKDKPTMNESAMQWSQRQPQTID